MKKNISFFLLIIFPLIAFPQQVQITNKSTKIKIIKGKKYYLHEVLPGQTLYSIAKAYNIKIQDIISENPESAEVLKVGTKLKIPIDKIQTPDKSAQSDEFYVIHKVKKGETLHSISKKYLVSKEDILSVNPSCKQNGTKTGEYLKIPLHLSKLKDPLKLVDKDKFIVYKVKKNETFYSISKKFNVTIETLIEANPQYENSLPEGAIIEIPLFEGKLIEKKFEKPAEVDSLLISKEKKFLDVYNVALMLPFYLNDNDSIDLHQKTNEEESIYPQTLPVLEFYEGMLLAIDSLRKQGLSIKLYVYDTSNDTNEVKQITQKPEFSSLNLIFGPLSYNNFSIVSQMANTKEKNTKIISFYNTDSILANKSNTCNVFPDDFTMIEKMAEYIADTYPNFIGADKKYNVIIVIHNDSIISPKDSTQKIATEENIFAEHFKKSLVAAQNKKKSAVPIKKIILKKSGMKGLYKELDQTDTSIVVLLSRNQAIVSHVITQLNYKSNSTGGRDKENGGSKIILFGMNELKDFENIEINYLNNLSLHIYSPSYIDYSREDVKNFIRKYRDKYKTEPSLYAFQGYDIAYYFLKALKDYGVNFNYFLPEIEGNLLQSRFHFEKIGKNGGYQNKYVYILKYEDYELKPVN